MMLGVCEAMLDFVPFRVVKLRGRAVQLTVRVDPTLCQFLVENFYPLFSLFYLQENILYNGEAYL